MLLFLSVVTVEGVEVDVVTLVSVVVVDVEIVVVVVVKEMNKGLKIIIKLAEKAL